MEDSLDTTASKRTRIEHKLIANARPHLREAQVLKIFRGQTAVSPFLLPLVGTLLFAVKPRAVLLTENELITVQQSRWSQSRVVRLISRHARGDADVRVSRFGLQIGGDSTIYALPTTLVDMRDVARLAAGAQAESALG